MSSNKNAGNNKPTIDNVNDTFDAAMAMGKEKVEQVQENYTRAYGEFSKFGQDTLGVYMKAGEILRKGQKTLGRQFLNWPKLPQKQMLKQQKQYLQRKLLMMW